MALGGGFNEPEEGVTVGSILTSVPVPTTMGTTPTGWQATNAFPDFTATAYAVCGHQA